MKPEMRAIDTLPKSDGFSFLIEALRRSTRSLLEERTMPMVGIDEVEAGFFTERLIDILNGGALALMISIGHRTGLFDTLARLPASSTEEIAADAGLDPSFTGHWLHTLAAGGVVRHDAEALTWHLPAEYVPALARAGDHNLASLARYVTCLAAFEDRIVESFASGEAVVTDDLPRLARLDEEVWGGVTAAPPIEVVLQLVPELRPRLEDGLDVLEVGCGAGRGLNILAETFALSRFAGLDPDPQAIARAEAERAVLALTNVRFAVCAPEPGIEGAYDLISINGPRHPQDLDGLLRAAASALRSGGRLLFQAKTAPEQEAGGRDPLAPIAHTVACIQQGGRARGSGPPPLQPRALCRLLRKAGFTGIRLERPSPALDVTCFIATTG